MEEFTRYLIYLRIQCGTAAFFGTLLGGMLWYSARRLSDLRYIRPDTRPGASADSVVVRARFMPKGVGIPRTLGSIAIL